jgi:hypothetical protein
LLDREVAAFKAKRDHYAAWTYKLQLLPNRNRQIAALVVAVVPKRADLFTERRFIPAVVFRLWLNDRELAQ